ncbi:hypothetical protein GCM10025857_68430 [Alicyclobacillus contaminans]|nr:hypothetical protein GCM10025857_68430 [Alicyclobacillus contaminans]
MFQLPAIAAWDQSSPAQVQRGTFFVEDIGPGRLAFSIGVPYSWLSSPDVMYPVVVDPTIVTGSGYSVARANRCVVQVSNGWLVVGIMSPSGSIQFYGSNDGGNTWSLRAYTNTTDPSAYYALMVSLILVYCVYMTTNGIRFYEFNPANANGALSQTAGISGPTYSVSGCSLARDPSGNTYLVYSTASTSGGANAIYESGTTTGTSWSTATPLVSASGKTSSIQRLDGSDLLSG